MKRFTLFLALLVGVGMGSVQAQKCSKAQKAACAKSASVSKVNDGSADAAAKLASLDDTIESRTCEKSGSVSYVRKVVDNETGTVSFKDVQYDSELGKFVNVSPSMKGCCSAKMKSASGCCAGKKGAVKSAEAAAPAGASDRKKS